jgi:hypothetical protein
MLPVLQELSSLARRLEVSGGLLHCCIAVLNSKSQKDNLKEKQMDGIDALEQRMWTCSASR